MNKFLSNLTLLIALAFPASLVAQQSEKPDTLTFPEPVFVVVEEMPVFPGGQKGLDKFIRKHVQYPAEERAQKTRGTVYVYCIVGADGKIGDLQVVKGLTPACDREALRVLGQSPIWEPGRQNGKAVPVKFVIPIRF